MHLVISPAAASGRRPPPDMRRDGYGGLDFDGSLDAPECFPRGGAFVSRGGPDSDATFDHGYTSFRGDPRDSVDSPASVCTPPATNASGQLDGSPVAGLGVCTHNSREWASVIAHAGSARYHRARFDDFCAAGLKASAARHKKAAEYHERYLRNYADGLLSGLHLF